jgi:hypothetical protein
VQHEAERARLTRTIEQDRKELRRAVRDLGLSTFLSLDLPQRIRRRPLPWALGALGLVAFVLVRQRKRARRD